MSEASIAERIGERVGYVIGALIFGPGAALEIRARRLTREAVLAYSEPLEPMQLVAPRRAVGRAVKLPASAGSIPLEIRVDLRDKRAELSAAIQPLPSYVQATIARDESALHGVRFRLGEALASSGNVRLVSETLDASSARALVEAVAKGPFDRVDAFELDLASEHLRTLVIAPTSAADWTPIGDGIIALTEWLAKKWPQSYR